MKNNNEVLRDLTKVIGGMVIEAVSKSVAKPEEIPVFQWKVKHFQYTDQGLVNPRAEGTYFSKRIWLTAINALSEKIREHGKYKDALEVLKRDYPETPEVSSYLETFIRTMTRLYIENSQPPDRNSLLTKQNY